MSSVDHTVHRARFHELDNRVLYDLLQLRSDVFVAEQECVFLDLDGRDHEPEAEHLWIHGQRGVLGTLRILHENGDTWSIGRVVTGRTARRAGVASALVEVAIDRLRVLGCREVVLGAQSHLADWYRRFGFEVHGDTYVEDGIRHVPMSRVLEPA